MYNIVMEGEIGESLTRESQTPENQSRWNLPDLASEVKVIHNESGKVLGQVVEFNVENLNPGNPISLDFSFDKVPSENYSVITGGWQTWSTSVSAGTIGEKLIGLRPFEKSLGEKTVPFFEPGSGNEQIDSNEGRSYGYIDFRQIKQGNNLFLGVIPDLKNEERIKLREEGERIVVTIEKDSVGSNSSSEKFRIFLGDINVRGENASYGEIIEAYAKELIPLVGDIKLMHDRSIGFSWASYGIGVDQKKVGLEVEAASGVIDTYVIDDGWETTTGSLQADKNKFPDLPALASLMKKLGIKPGIWVAPFLIKQEAAGNLPANFFMKDAKGKPYRISEQMLQSDSGSILPTQKPFGLDISVPEFREYLVGKFVELANMGFEVFKVDYLAVPFTGPLQNHDQTKIQYYRKIFTEIREAVRQTSGKEIEFIGCGAPMMESIGLFEGIRMTGDSVLTDYEQMPRYGRLIAGLNKIGLTRYFSKLNTDRYKDAAAVASRRSLIYKYAHGLILDGVHLNDKKIYLDSSKKALLSEMFLALRRLGVSNLFVGDGLARLNSEQKQSWKEYVARFKAAAK